MNRERRKLKQFIEDHIPFYELNQVGFWPKGTRKTDYEKIAARVCHYFGFKSVYEFDAADTIEVPGANVVVGKFQDKVDAEGFKPGEGFLLDICESTFTCPICECNQEAKNNKKAAYTMKCKGCKRKLFIVHQLNGSIEITEINNHKQ